MKFKYFLAVLLIFTVKVSFSANVDTVLVYSLAMKKDVKCVVIKPNGYNASSQYPVTYLLHGYSDNYRGWVKVDTIKDLCDLYNMLIVCPDGGYSSWYWDSPIDSTFKYETFTATELVVWIDKQYATIKSKIGRAITGLSMGGQGALFLAIRHQDIFGAAGSMSGGVDIRPFPNNWDMAKRLGKYAQFADRWNEYAVVNMLHLIEPNSLSIIIDCGINDFFFNVNEELHKKLLYYNIPHDYIIRQGAHTWDYWKNAVQYQLLFMHLYFKKANI